jgi:hypothetical protein
MILCNQVLIRSMMRAEEPFCRWGHYWKLRERRFKPPAAAFGLFIPAGPALDVLSFDHAVRVAKEDAATGFAQTPLA